MAADLEDVYDLGYAHAVARVRDAASVLITNMRTRIEDCHCGWAELGKSHAQHVADALADHLNQLRQPSRPIDRSVTE